MIIGMKKPKRKGVKGSLFFKKKLSPHYLNLLCPHQRARFLSFFFFTYCYNRHYLCSFVCLVFQVFPPCFRGEKREALFTTKCNVLFLKKKADTRNVEKKRRGAAFSKTRNASY